MIKAVLEQTPPELSADIIEKGNQKERLKSDLNKNIVINLHNKSENVICRKLEL